MIGVKAKKQKQHSLVGVKSAPPGIYLIRHGKTRLNKGHGDTSPDRIRGWVDVPLDEEGKKEAKELGHKSKQLHATSLYSSDLKRASDVAEEISKNTGLEVQRSRSFRPWNLGNFQGQPAEDVVPKLADYIKDSGKEVPGGESFDAFRHRFLGALQHVMDNTKGSAIIVTHFRGVKLTQAWLNAGGKDDVDLETFQKDDAPTGSIMRVFKDGKEWDYEMLADDGDISTDRRSLPPVHEVDDSNHDDSGNDEEGEAISLADPEEAKKADFITLPKDIDGTNCENCKHEKHGICHFDGEVAGVHVDLRGQKVDERHCCAAWDAAGVVRLWEKK